MIAMRRITSLRQPEAFGGWLMTMARNRALDQLRLKSERQRRREDQTEQLPQIAAAGAGRLQVLSQRRLMLKVASELGRREGAEVLVTGDSLGQVSSQTLHNLSVVEQAADLPLLRPLVAWDKAEIVREAEDIGTFAVSALPAEDCCTLFASPLAETRAPLEKLATLETRVDADRIVAELVASAECVRPQAQDRLHREDVLAHARGRM